MGVDLSVAWCDSLPNGCRTGRPLLFLEAISTAALRPAAIGNETADAGALKAFRQLRLAISSKRHQVSRLQQHEPQS
jgi:hypothetical protein